MELPLVAVRRPPGSAEQASAGFVLRQSESGADLGSGLRVGLGPVRGRAVCLRDDVLQSADRPQGGQRAVRPYRRTTATVPARRFTSPVVAAPTVLSR
ncbi:hypothetical protein [Streptomyces microflavus]|uniref:hypothetical protein n=1 Tax=Streptomyces microflavus TaxID=1919 RepID=UPI0033A48011